MKNIKTAISSHPLIAIIFALIISECVIYFWPSGNSTAEMILPRIILSIFVLGIIVLAGGKTVLVLKPKAITFSLKKGAYLLILAGLMFVLLLIVTSLYPLILDYAVSAGEDLAQSQSLALPADWVSQIISTFVLCIFVGIFEEGLFRGIVFDGLISKMGGSRKGIVWAMIISSFLFGFVHVWTIFLGGGVTTSSVLQAILKTVETGMFGFFLAAVYLKTNNIWGAVIMHTLFDFLLMAAQVMTGSSGVEGTYVSSGSIGDFYIILYSIVSIVQIPLVVSAYRMIKQIPLPAQSIFTNRKKNVG